MSEKSMKKEIPSYVWFLSFIVLIIPWIVDDYLHFNEGFIQITWMATLLPTILFTYHGGLAIGIITVIIGISVHSLFQISEIYIERNPFHISVFLASITIQIIVWITIGLLFNKLKTKELMLLQLTKDLKRLSLIDELTGLYNRRGLLMLSKQYLSKNEKAICIFLDLDGFKLVNDLYGHEIGDEVLKRVSNNIKELINTSEIAGRIGGDEFLILLTNVEEIRVNKIIKLLKKNISDVKTIKGNKINVSASIGAAKYPKDGTSIEVLIKNADNAMYHVKKRGKNDFHFYSLP